jgi:hypothetical protein
MRAAKLAVGQCLLVVGQVTLVAIAKVASSAYRRLMLRVSIIIERWIAVMRFGHSRFFPGSTWRDAWDGPGLPPHRYARSDKMGWRVASRHLGQECVNKRSQAPSHQWHLLSSLRTGTV